MASTLVALALLWGTGTACAADAKADPLAGISPEKRAAIDKMMQMTNARDLMDRVAQQDVQLLSNALKAQNPDQQKAQIVDILMQHFTQVFHAHQDQFMQMIYLTYDKYLTLDDLKGSIEFYKTPAGQHILAAMPQVSKDLIAASMLMGRQLRREAIQDSIDDLKAHGIKVPS